MIGQLINEFDASQDNTLAAFNKTFKMDIKGSQDAPVVIGGMTIGGLREVLINGNMKLLELDVSKIPVTPRKSHYKNMKGRLSPSYYYIAKKEGEEDLKFEGLRSIADHFERAISTMTYYANGTYGLLNGWKITREKIKKGN